MKPFRFPLQRVLDVKQLQEKQQRLRLADARRRVDEAEDEWGVACRGRERAVGRGNGTAVGADPLLRGLNWRERERWRRRVLLQEERVEDARRRLEKERSELLTARKARRTLERLRERMDRNYRRDQERRGQQVVDELFLARFARNGGEPDDE